jgi:nucleotide-binding universal stress UspA family protein/sporulation protein YlmC with PRC-barrel domain
VTPSHDAGLRILAPLDDSVESQRALTYAQALATATGGSLKLVRATDLDDQARFNSLASNAERLRDAGVDVEWSVVSGVDGQTAIREAEAAWRPDLIALATTKMSRLDRRVNGSVAEAVVKSARVPVLMVPRDLDRSLVARGIARILIALDGSTPAERAVDVVLQLASRIPLELILVRAIHAEHDRRGAEDYLRHIASRVEPMLEQREVAWRVVVGSPATAILDSARELDVDAIALSTRGHGAAHLLSIGSTAAEVVDLATVPVILLGPGALADVHTARVKFGADVRTADGTRIGEVHRVIVQLDQQAIVAVVVLGGGILARDVLVPLDVIGSAGEHEVRLRLRHDRIEQLPDFTYNEFDVPPPMWTENDVAVARERVRLSPAQRDFTVSTRVRADDGAIGRVDQVDFDPETGHLIALWVRADGLLRRRLRIPSEWLRGADTHADLHLGGSRADVEAYVGAERT